MPRVTVLMPVRNGARYIEAAVMSILGQTYTDFELLVVDDGSTDETPALLARIASRDSRVRAVSRSPAGIVAALNFGLGAADGDYVARMDADDIAFPRRLEWQVRALDARPRLIACGGNYLVFGAERALGISALSDAACKARLLLFPCFLHSSTMLRRSALKRTGIVYRSEFPHCEDYRLWSELAQHGEFANLPRPLMRYRSHPGQVSVEHRRLQRETHARIAAENLRNAGAAGVSEDALLDFLWPQHRVEGGGRFSPRYAVRSFALMRRLCGHTRRHQVRLAAMMLVRIARNLVQHPD